MDEKIILILNEMSEYLSITQMKKLQEVIIKTFADNEACKIEISNEEFLKMFLDAKRIEGCSERTIIYYQATVKHLLSQITTEVRKITTEEIREYLSNYQKWNNCSNVTIDNVRRNISSFFSWLEEEDYILKSPMKRIHKIKTDKVVKETLSDETLELIEFAKKKSKESNDAFDISIYPIVELWGFPTQKYRVPSDSEIQKLLKNVNSQKIKINKKTNVVTLEKNMKIDLGGIAKGYTSQRIAKIYKKDGVKSGVISLGGNVQAIGTKTDGSRWKVGVQSPDDTESMIGAYEAADEAVITSGAYERYFEKDGKTYHHIIDPATGKPTNGATTGCHLHIGFRIENNYVNPLDYLQ